METKSISVGLDIGTTKIVAMIGRQNDYGKLEILGRGNGLCLRRAISLLKSVSTLTSPIFFG